MPCADPLPTPEETEFQRRVSANRAAAAEILCDLCLGVTNKDQFMQAIREWWPEHVEIDAERERLKDKGAYYV